MGCGFSCGDETIPRILMLGMKGAGKTTILHQLKDDEQIKVFSVQDFNTQTIEWDDYEICVWDLGVGERQRNLWRHYFEGSVCVIFVVDASNKDLIKTAKAEFNKITQVTELNGCPLCFMINKENEEGALTNDEIEFQLNIANMKHSNYKLFRTNAIEGKGIDEAMKWVRETLEKKLNK